jgi:hypothetical protein
LKLSGKARGLKMLCGLAAICKVTKHVTEIDQLIAVIEQLFLAFSSPTSQNITKLCSELWLDLKS